MISYQLSTRQKVVRFTLVGTVPLILTILFLWSGGWLSPQLLSSDKIVTVLQQVSDKHPGYRRNHAKGVCFTGEFISNGNASTFSRALVFAEGVKTPVIGRFSIGGGNPSAADYAIPVRSMALLFQLADGQQWRTGMNAIPFFQVSTVQGFYDLQIASRPEPTTGKPDPEKMKAFVMQHPEMKNFLSWVKQYTPSSSWGSDTFNSLNAFRFIDKLGQRHLVRWSMVSQTPRQQVTTEEKIDKDFLHHDLEKRLADGPLKWDLVITLAEAGDAGNNASKAWPADRRTIRAGTLIVTRMQPQQQGECNSINYDPLILPDGITASDDPLLNARSSAYARSYNLRTRELSGYQL
ncbi:TPA: catalase family peroxidase [Escherichia coli]|nr:catalase family peroxidase [Escherichia coli]HEL8044551.1 catalase family peroxidase [Escherichia coli]HEL8049329.1 catalase family peroxidase [Escherichia coli]HEL8054080.1 catalase family peroxidase [Escherichia coli]HEL8058930.1 catalase family peroxidase [Escherichia coli]